MLRWAQRLAVLTAASALITLSATVAVPTANADPTGPVARARVSGEPIGALPGEALAVQISHVTPSVLTPKKRGRVTISGVVRNTSDETWRNISLYALISTTPFSDAVGLQAGIDSDPLLPIGLRITETNNFTKVGALLAGQQADFTFSVRRDLLPVSQPGVYWLGVQALGENQDGRDDVIEGRARVLMPLAEAKTPPLAVSLVATLRMPSLYRSGGRLAGTETWAAALAPDGLLARAIDFAGHPRADDLTWLVDPSVLASVSHLSLGNPVRSLQRYMEPEPTPDEEDPVAAADETTTTAAEDQLTLAARLWLSEAGVLTRRGQLLSLPFGDPDPSATTAAPRLLELARDQAQATLPTAPSAFAPRSGLVAPKAVSVLPPGSTVFVGQQATETDGAAVFKVLTHTFVRSTRQTATSQPGESSPSLATRQWLLARAVVGRPEPSDVPEEAVIALLDPGWLAEDPADFFDGLDPSLITLQTVTESTQGVPPTYAASELRYSPRARSQQIASRNFTAATELLNATELAETVFRSDGAEANRWRAVAFAGITDGLGDAAPAARRTIQSAERTLNARLAEISVEGPSTLRLLSEQGAFTVIANNETSAPVRVTVSAESLSSTIQITGGRTLTLAPGAHQTVNFQAQTDKLGRSQIVVRAVNSDGQQVGLSDTIPVRSAQVSPVFWWIIGTGATLLFGTIALRLGRRIRDAAAAKGSAAPLARPPVAP